MTQEDILRKVRLAVRVTTTAFDEQLTDLIEAAFLDLKMAGIEGENVVSIDAATLQAVITYCKIHFGSPDDYDQLAKMYETQKGQLWAASGYTIWPDGVA